ncbi:uncharacterized protein LOC128174109 [Crassostrea angulata]|uniref:uncharacterized protein LOC128174109 n=1 Tax=Magallana angulata TaxID=2784310 RepID=UPI0022B164F3|nr:uncharacterized protein LOC128174109 [Crassostrea angulata]
MAITVLLVVFPVCFIASNSAFLLHGDKIPGHTTTLGPLGKDAYLSLLVQEVLDLKAQVKSQQQEIQSLKIQKVSEDNAPANTVNKSMSEYIDIKSSFGIIKHEFDHNNNQTGLLALKARIDNMAKSIRYLTLFLQGHEIQDEETNKTIYREFEHLNAKLLSENQVLHEEIQNLTNIESAEIHRLELVQQTKLTTLGSEIATQITKLNNTILRLSDYKIRLFGGDSNSGRVEILYFGQWGTVCDDNFDNNDAKVVCRMLGLATTNAVAYGNDIAHYGEGTGPIYFDDLGCTGSEPNLFSCPHNLLGDHNCYHDEDAGVQCGKELS